MLKTSILPVLYDGVTTLYTLTQSYFVTRLVTAHKTVPPMELFQFVPTKSLTEFNTALQVPLIVFLLASSFLIHSNAFMND